MAPSVKRVVLMSMRSFRRGRFPVPDECWELTETEWRSLVFAVELALSLRARDDKPMIRGYRRPKVMTALKALKLALGEAGILPQNPPTGDAK